MTQDNHSNFNNHLDFENLGLAEEGEGSSSGIRGPIGVSSVAAESNKYCPHLCSQCGFRTNVQRQLEAHIR